MIYTMRLLLRRPSAAFGLLFVVSVILMAFLLPLPYDPRQVDPNNTLVPPNGTHWFGTDGGGGDVFSRVVAAARLDVPLALAAAFLSGIIGVPLGLAASRAGKGSAAILKALDIVQSFPLIVLAIVIVALTGNNIRNVALVIVLINAPQFIRLVRSAALVVRSRRYVEAARMIGADPWRISSRHVLPNITSTVLAQLSLSVSTGLLAIAALSFIGVGIVPPTPSWGSEIRLGTPLVVTGQWWVAVFPGAVLVLFIMSFSLIAEGLSAVLRRES